jgi:hypothetical protein
MEVLKVELGYLVLVANQEYVKGALLCIIEKLSKTVYVTVK